MKTLVLLVLLLVWGALIATWLRSRAQDGGFSDPVGTFNRHLRVLEKTAPSRFAAANPRRPPRPTAIAAYRPVTVARTGPMAAARQGRPTSAALRRAQIQKRRRDVFYALVAGVVGSLVLAMVPGLRVMVYIQVLFDLLLGAYIALLMRLRNLAAERELKLAYLNTAGGPGRVPLYGGVGEARPRGLYGVARYDAHSDDYGYGDLAVRRAAN